MNLLALDEVLSFSGLSGELRMLPTLLEMLRRRRWIGSDSAVIQEFPLNGRRVDLVTATSSGVLSAFELKLGGFGRVLEQAAYNRLTFDRSWVVVDRNPMLGNVEEARFHGIGIIVIAGSSTKVLCRPGPPNFEPSMRSRLAARIRLERSDV